MYDVGRSFGRQQGSHSKTCGLPATTSTLATTQRTWLLCYAVLAPVLLERLLNWSLGSR